MTGILDDFFEGVAEVFRGGRKATRAAGAAADRVDVVLDHVLDEKTVTRVVQAGVGAAVEAAGEEIKAAASKPPGSSPRRARECLGIACSKHGNQPWSEWRKTLVCGAEGCGRIYQTQNAHGARFAPAICACGARLLPPAAPDGKPSSAEPICSTCFDEIGAGSGRATRRAPP